MITGHKFRNGCRSDCAHCRKESDNMCSAVTVEYSYCYKTRVEHYEIEPWSTYTGYVAHSIFFTPATLVKEECPKCHRVITLGDCSDNSRMCQSCFMKLSGAEQGLPSDLM